MNPSGSVAFCSNRFTVKVPFWLYRSTGLFTGEPGKGRSGQIGAWAEAPTRATPQNSARTEIRNNARIRDSHISLFNLVTTGSPSLAAKSVSLLLLDSVIRSHAADKVRVTV